MDACMQADLDNSESLVAALKQVDVVISALGAAALLDGQLKLVEAIKQAGNITVIQTHSINSQFLFTKHPTLIQCRALIDCGAINQACIAFHFGHLPLLECLHYSIYLSWRGTASGNSGVQPYTALWIAEIRAIGVRERR